MITEITNNAVASIPLAPLGLAQETPLFLADWTDVLFIHFAVDRAVLQPHVPFPLDLHSGRAFVSLVAFTQRRLRPRMGGRISAMLATPLAEHPFLNLRTYVRVAGEPGIYFLAERIPNRLAVVIGPRLYGLPYRLAQVTYHFDAKRRLLTGEVRAAGRRLRFESWIDVVAPPQQIKDLSHFLLERYTAWTIQNNVARRFRIRHEPWDYVQSAATLSDATLLNEAAPWFAGAAPAGAHYAPGVTDVEIGAPKRERRQTVAHKAAISKTGDARQTPHAEPKFLHLPSFILHPRIPSWLPLLALPALALLTASALPAWAFMWVLAGSIFLGCKWLTWSNARARGLRPSIPRSMAYLFGWVGMDAETFLDESTLPHSPALREWVRPVVNILLGAVLVFAIARYLDYPFLAGWAGMIGLVLLLHFGSFHLLALLYQQRGVNAEPLMRSPTRATTLAEFWGERWNRGFHRLAERYIFRPTRRMLGAKGATMAAFVASGLVHDLVISLPARGGYGLPTLYFVCQGLGLLVQRRLRLTRGPAARLFTLAVAAFPAPLLFHNEFVIRVVLPFLRAIGAVGKELSS